MIQLRVHQTVDHVWSRDPALDKGDGDPEAEKKFAAAWRAFLDGGNVSILPLRDGQRPTIWRLRSLKREHRLQLSDLAAGKLANMVKDQSMLEGIFGLAFLRGSDHMLAGGLVGVSGLQDDQGRAVTFEVDKNGLTRDQLDQLHLLGMHFVNELGGRIGEISEPDPTRGRG